MIKNLEIEFKYRADNISLIDFSQFCERRNPDNVILASGYDYFYSDKKGSDNFARHRVGPSFNQLTLKKKTTDKNSYVRTEHNISLANNVTKEQTTDLCAELGFEYDTTIFKNVFVYEYNSYTLVYYVCYNEDLKELGRFVEIEMKEDYEWENKEEAFEELEFLESQMKPLGITAQNRTKKSLFEMYRRNNK